MKFMKKILSFLSMILITALILGVFASCGEKKQENTTGGGDNPTDANENQQPESTAEPKILPDLPDVDYAGYTFTFLSHAEGFGGWDWVTADPRELVSEEESGEPINDAVYKRNSVIKEKYNIEIAMVTNNSEQSMLSKAVKAGDDIYDAVVIYNNNVPGVVTGDLLTDISKLTFIDRSKPWWDDGVNSMSIAHRNYLLAGDLLILDNEATNAIIFNKDLLANFGLELPYAAAKDGKWTMDMLNELSRVAEADLNGDGKMTHTDDRFGLITFNDTLQAMLVAGGGAFAAKDADDIPYMCFAEPKNISILEKAMDLMYKSSNTSVFNVQSLDAGTNNATWMTAYYDPFMENRALFMWIRMRVVEVFRGMESNFGILPMPKYDELQPDYCSLVNPYTGVMLGVPKSVSDLDRAGVILEALSAESKYTLQPAYYDIVLSRKFTRDEESSDMLDIIFSTRTYDIGGVYSFGGVFSDFCTLASKEDRNIASYYDKKIASMEKAIAKVVDKYTAME